MVVPQDVIRVRVHPSVNVIPERAFCERRRLEEIELCDGLLEIGEWAFNYCSSLKRVSMPTSLRTIGSHAFWYCTKLEEVILCEGLLEIGSYAFNCCEALKRISIPSTVTIINDHAIANCGSLQDVELNEGLLEIRQYAFYRCYKLKSINIPPTVSIIGKWAFAYGEKLEDAGLCKGLLEIGEFAFLCCNLLKQIIIPSTVSRISNGAFKKCGKLEKVELNEGLVEIGVAAFCECYWLDSIKFPSTLRTIRKFAFCCAFLNRLTLPDGIESIEDNAFWSWYGSFTIVRIPPTVTTITGSMCYARGLFSIELPESMKRIDDEAFDSCMRLRNLAIPINTEVGIDAFKDCMDLKEFGTERNIIKTLKHRFDNLPIHQMLYYQSFGKGRIMRSKFDDPSIKQQDSLGMTPLHILACSGIQNIELYRMLIDKHPESLVTKDRWGATPFLYAIWANTGSKIVKFLFQICTSIFPDYLFDWNGMLDTLGRAHIPDAIDCVYRIQKEFPDQCIDWDRLVEKAITRSNCDHTYVTLETFREFVAFSILARAKAMKKCSDLFDQILNMLYDYNLNEGSRRDFVKDVHNKLEALEDKYNRMMEALTSIELVLWKMKMDDCCCGHQKKTRQSKKMRMDDSAMRKQCRIKCGAETNIVIEHILPYLDIL